jgi:hypothetical protein
VLFSPCPHCRTPIDPDAEVCPQCHRDRTPAGFLRRSLWAVPLLSLLLAILAQVPLLLGAVTAFLEPPRARVHLEELSSRPDGITLVLTNYGELPGRIESRIGCEVLPRAAYPVRVDILGPISSLIPSAAGASPVFGMEAQVRMRGLPPELGSQEKIALVEPFSLSDLRRKINGLAGSIEYDHNIPVDRLRDRFQLECRLGVWGENDPEPVRFAIDYAREGESDSLSWTLPPLTP